MNQKACPICMNKNQCGSSDEKNVEECWCMAEVFPESIFKRVPVEALNKSCICKACLDKHKSETN
ncbi:cysteine-rich CWC family protein [Priestia megaterium]|nr:cysteine-rich CWC family protein [Priestia megaterium]